ncbi:MAG: hypothetical protein ACOCRX_07465, partial [Candidatus Woesearchaeota archaeon]
MKVIREVSKNELKDFLYESMDINDPNLYEEVRDEDSIGIFQFNGGTAKRLVGEIQPQNFEELNAVNAMARPGPIELAPNYIEGKNGAESKYHSLLDDILQTTYNVPLYQEQVLKIFQVVGGFTLEEADGIRGLMKKLGKLEKDPEDLKKWDKITAKFKKGALERGLSENEAELITNDLVSFAGYNFNRCFSGDMVIDGDNTSYWQPTIEEMYLTKNDRNWAKENGHLPLYKKYNREGYRNAKSLTEDGRLHLNKIVDIYKREIQDVYKIILEDGKEIVVSANHKFPTENGELTINTGLKEGVELFVNNGYEKTDYKKWNFTDIETKEREFKNTYEGKGFQEGEENVAYVNGEYAKFKKNRKILLEESNNKCSICEIEHDRLECHHIDGDRLNNELENLIIVCPSCHKKMDYKYNKRKRKNSKGALTKKVKIKKIEYAGKKQTYDVEMAPPYHTLCVNGIVASNSHSTAYTYIAVITLYLSYYFRKYFYSSVLEYEVDRDKYLIERLITIKNHGFKVIPPNVNKSKETITPGKGNEIIFGLADVKNVGNAAAKKIIEEQPFTDFFDYIMRTRSRQVTSATTKALIKIGAFDDLINKERKKYLQAFNNFWESKGNTKVREKLEIKWKEALR